MYRCSSPDCPRVDHQVPGGLVGICRNFKRTSFREEWKIYSYKAVYQTLNIYRCSPDCPRVDQIPGGFAGICVNFKRMGVCGTHFETNERFKTIQQFIKCRWIFTVVVHQTAQEQIVKFQQDLREFAERFKLEGPGSVKRNLDKGLPFSSLITKNTVLIATLWLVG